VETNFADVFNLAKTRELSGDELKKYIMTMVNEYDKYVIGGGYRKSRRRLISAPCKRQRTSPGVGALFVVRGCSA
jgi:hypothetical protein